MKKETFVMSVTAAFYLTSTSLFVAFADSEASYQSCTESVIQSGSENGHIGESETSRQSQGNISSESVSGSTHENATESITQAGGPSMNQPSISSAATYKKSGSSRSGSAQSINFVGDNEDSPKPAAVQQATVPQMRVVNYFWSKK